jgi:hypothetical protein
MKRTHLTIAQGIPFRLLVRVKERDELGILIPMSLVGSVVRLQARPSVNSEELLLDLSSNGTGITLGAELGEFTIHMTSAETRDLSWGRLRAVYQCEVEPAADDTFRALMGTLTLDPEVVR